MIAALPLLLLWLYGVDSVNVAFYWVILNALCAQNTCSYHCSAEGLCKKPFVVTSSLRVESSSHVLRDAGDG